MKKEKIIYYIFNQIYKLNKNELIKKCINEKIHFQFFCFHKI